jgi:hypothetical protein
MRTILLTLSWIAIITGVGSLMASCAGFFVNPDPGLGLITLISLLLIYLGFFLKNNARDYL